MAQDGWSGLFTTAFKQSKNAMALVDAQRRHVEVNPAYLRLLGYARDGVIGRPVYEFVVNGPLLSPERWTAALAAGRFHGEAQLIRADGTHVGVQWAGNTEIVTGRRLVLFVALGTSRWGGSFRRTAEADPDPRALSARELEIVRLIARGESGPRSPPSSTSPTTRSGRTCATRWRRSARARGRTSSRRSWPRATPSPEDPPSAVSTAGRRNPIIVGAG